MTRNTNHMYFMAGDDDDLNEYLGDKDFGLDFKVKSA